MDLFNSVNCSYWPHVNYGLSEIILSLSKVNQEVISFILLVSVSHMFDLTLITFGPAEKIATNLF